MVVIAGKAKVVYASTGWMDGWMGGSMDGSMDE